MNAVVVSIHTASSAGVPLRALTEAKLEPGKGLLGDRYASGTGTFSERLKWKPDAELTLIESEEIDRFNELEQSTRLAGEFRRNIVTQGVRLNDLVGRRFKVGAVELEGIRLCEPCTHLAKLVSPAVVTAMVHRAGLRARVVTGGTIRPGDPIVATSGASRGSS